MNLAMHFEINWENLARVKCTHCGGTGEKFIGFGCADEDDDGKCPHCFHGYNTELAPPVPEDLRERMKKVYEEEMVKAWHEYWKPIIMKRERERFVVEFLNVKNYKEAMEIMNVLELE